MTPLTTALFLALCAQDQAPALRLDPLLLAEVVEVFSVLAADPNPIWPGWDARATPILLYFPGVQDALLNHPRPPEGFRRVPSPLLPAGWTLDLRDGETLFTLDGQNTSTTVNGIETLVVADTFSNLRPNLAQLLHDPRPAAERERDLTLELFAGDPYDGLGMFVHEAFHVHQARASSKAANEALLLQIPWLAAENTAGFALEGVALGRALVARSEDEAFEAALEFLAVRKERRAKLPAVAASYEDGTEWNEGLAKYTEWKLASVLEGRTPHEALRWRRGFRGYADTSAWRARLLRALRGNCSGEVVVNGDPYGAGGLRFRLYYTGMALGALLDRLGMDDWRARIFEPGTTLTGLVEELLAPDAGDLAAALQRAREKGDWPKLLAAKQKLEADGAAAAQAAARAIESSAQLFTLDYSRVETTFGLGFTPFGITKVGPEQTIYGQIPMQCELGSQASFQQDRTAPILHDGKAKTASFVLAGPFDPKAAGIALGKPLDDLELALPGVTLKARRAIVKADGGRVRVELVP
jgi:hypothetical protein